MSSTDKETINEIENTANEYCRSVYPKMDENERQFKESKQHFIMGVWAFFQLTKNNNFTKEKASELEKEIRDYYTKRSTELNKNENR